MIGLKVNGFGPKKFVKFIRSNTAAGAPEVKRSVLSVSYTIINNVKLAF